MSTKREHKCGYLDEIRKRENSVFVYRAEVIFTVYANEKASPKAGLSRGEW
jgi:hypothetical protein